MCQACRCICICPYPWQPCHCFCRVGSDRCRSPQGTALWPFVGRVSSPQSTELPSPALTAAAAGWVKRVKMRRKVYPLKFKSFILLSPHLLFYDLWEWSHRLSPVGVHFPVVVWTIKLDSLQSSDMWDASPFNIHLCHFIVLKACCLKKAIEMADIMNATVIKHTVLNLGDGGFMK